MSDFGDLINIEEFNKREQFEMERGEVGFYCKDCRKMIKAERPNSNGYTFICPNCKGINIAIGTIEGLKTNYKIKGNL